MLEEAEGDDDEPGEWETDDDDDDDDDEVHFNDFPANELCVLIHEGLNCCRTRRTPMLVRT